MCGIVGAVAAHTVARNLFNGLTKLEYRGYDSAGISILNNKGEINRLRLAGKVRDLEELFNDKPFDGQLGIAHTRWATHGLPTVNNAHPFISHNEIALVHNGIIENSKELREQLLVHHYIFESETDSEVIVHLIHFLNQQYQNIYQSIRAVMQELRGSYAVCMLYQKEPANLYAFRKGSPLVIGLGENGNYVSSDIIALNELTNRFIFLEDGDFVSLDKDKINIYDINNHLTMRKIQKLKANVDCKHKGNYAHYMQKEIMEQAEAVQTCLKPRIKGNKIGNDIFGPHSDKLLAAIKFVDLIACGTSYHAACVGKFWLEELAAVSTNAEIASEFRYHKHIVNKDSLCVAISQSGETADTLAALRFAKTYSYRSFLAICNVVTSSLIRETNLNFITHAGVEIGVASTKSFSTQLAALMLLALQLQPKQSAFHEPQFILQFKNIPNYIDEVLRVEEVIKNWAQIFSIKQHALFLGRNLLYPIACEGALKLKEISYIHAEAYPAGELKHGPLALVDNKMPVVVLAPSNLLYEKIYSNIEEIHARAGELFVLTDDRADLSALHLIKANVILLPFIHHLLTPFIYTIPLQLLAYHVARLKGTDIDQPRNLAKSVTVE